MIDPFSTEYVLGVAFGLGGAAAFSLAGPMARGAWRFAYWCIYIADSIVLSGFRDADWMRNKWYPVSKREAILCDIENNWNGNGLMNVDGRTHDTLKTADGLAQTRIAALEERMDAVEEPTKVMGRSHEATTWKNLRDDAPAREAVLRGWEAFAKAQPLVTFGSIPTPYSSGKPCPKPTKDLRPGGCGECEG